MLHAYSTKNGQRIWEYDTVREFKTVNGVAAKGGSMAGPGPVVAGGMLSWGRVTSLAQASPETHSWLSVHNSFRSVGGITRHQLLQPPALTPVLEPSEEPVLFEKHSADHRIEAADCHQVDLDVAGNIPNQVDSLGEGGNAAAVQDGVRRGVENLNGFAAIISQSRASTATRCVFPSVRLRTKLNVVPLNHVAEILPNRCRFAGPADRWCRKPRYNSTDSAPRTPKHRWEDSANCWRSNIRPLRRLPSSCLAWPCRNPRSSRWRRRRWSTEPLTCQKRRHSRRSWRLRSPSGRSILSRERCIDRWTKRFPTPGRWTTSQFYSKCPTPALRTAALARPPRLRSADSR